jgi:hypothetical protein
MAAPARYKISLHIVLIAVSVAVWCYLFRFFLDASAPLQGDAYPYLGHIRFYVENIMQGVYPLWDPLRDNGNVNEFFLRRIGEFNPFFWLIAVFKTIGISFVVSHRLFFAFYYFLGLAGFYLLSQRLFRDERVSLASAVILMFSSLGNKAFESFILLEIVPAVWFAYFLAAFMQTPRPLFLLGAAFCLMIINITYIPFYFYTAFVIFLLCFLVVYAPHIKEFYGRTAEFVVKHKVFSAACAGLWAVSLIPGFLWYLESRRGESFSMIRHAGSSDVSAAAVGINKVNEGGILTYLIWDRQFVHLDKLELSDFYVPFFLFLIILTAIWSRLNRRTILLFAFGFIMFLIGLADATVVHGFLYQHLSVFRFFRNPQFFLWMVVLPVFVLFAMEQLRVFLQDCKDRTFDRRWMTLWVIFVHAGAALFCFGVGTVSYAVYAVIILSSLWTLGHIWGRLPAHIGLWVLWAATIVQPVEVFHRFASTYSPAGTTYDYAPDFSLNLPTVERRNELLSFNPKNLKDRSLKGNPSYFSVRGYHEATTNIDPDILFNFAEAAFIAYDAVEQMPGEEIDYARVQRSMEDFANLAFVHSDQAPPGKINVPGKARLMSRTENDFKVLEFKANRTSVRTNFPEPKFLVKTSNYHSSWKVRIDGKPADLFRTNVLALGLWVPAGEHVIEWRFEKGWRYPLAYFFVVLYLSVLGFLLWLSFSKKLR